MQHFRPFPPCVDQAGEPVLGIFSASVTAVRRLQMVSAFTINTRWRTYLPVVQTSAPCVRLVVGINACM